MLKHTLLKAWLLLALAAPGLWAAPIINSVSRSADQVKKYAKLELTVGLTAAFTNAYDPAEIAARMNIEVPKLPPDWAVNDVQIFPSHEGGSVEASIVAASLGRVSMFAAHVDSDQLQPPAGKAKPGEALRTHLSRLRHLTFGRACCAGVE